jgi:adenylylsulfate kinase
MKILIMGLPGSGKSYLAQKLKTHLDAANFSGENMRQMANDWDFSREGRIFQALRMTNIANLEMAKNKTVICDFICPYNITRDIFEADYTIWMNTIPRSKYQDTNDVFESPNYADLVIEKFLTDEEIASVVNKIANVHN